MADPEKIAAKPDHVEAVARAICLTSDYDPDFIAAFSTEPRWKSCIPEAQAAIAAMPAPVVTDARIKRFESACWQVLAYDQMLRTITATDTLFAGDRPDVDAVYDAMVKAVTAALGAKP